MAIKNYKLALAIWHAKIQYPSLYSSKDFEMESLRKKCWGQAGRYIAAAEKSLDEAPTNGSVYASEDSDIQAQWKKIEDEVLHH